MMTGLFATCARRAWLALVALATCIAVVQPAAARAERPRYAAILIDARTGEVLYANAADEQRHPASITKVMTLYLAFDALVAGRLRLSDPIVMSRYAASQRPSRLGLAPGKSLTLDDAIHIITVKSANDVAVALAERIGGSERGFAELMTRKARALGMNGTTFTNATGLPDRGNVTTARDIATLSAALLRAHPSYYAYFGQQAFKYDKISFTNHNRLLGKLTGLDGIKTGFTNDAGFTLAASAIRDGRRLITVVLGEPSIAARNRDVTALLDAGFLVLDRRAAGEDTSVAFNLPTLNHPALRVAEMAGEQGSRGDIVMVRNRAAAPARRDEERTAAKSTKDRKRATAETRSARAAPKKGKSKASPDKKEKLATARGKSGTRDKDKKSAVLASAEDKKGAERGTSSKTSRSANAKSKTKSASATKLAKADDAKPSAKKKSARERDASADDRRRPDKAGAKAERKRAS